MEMFKEWAAFCVANDLTFNGVFDTSMTLWDALQYSLRIGHAQIVNVGTRYTVAIERAEDAQMMFSVANMVSGSFKNTWLPLQGRANEVEVKYYDRLDNYKEKTARVYSPEAITAGRPQRTSTITLFGCVDALIAMKEAQLQLNLNKYILQSIEFGAPIEAIACTVGDVIYVQHDMPAWAQGGRTEAGSTTTAVVLDRPVTMEGAKTYKLLVLYDAIERFTGTVDSVLGNSLILNGYSGADNVKRIIIGGNDLEVLSVFDAGGGDYGVILDSTSGITAGNSYALWDTDAIEERAVTLNIGTDNTTVNVTSALPSAPAQYQQWMFGETVRARKPFRVKAISGGQENTRTIDAIEYNESFYDMSGIVTPTINYSSLTNAVDQVTIADVTEELSTIGSTVRTRCTVNYSSTQESYRTSQVFLSRSGGPFLLIGADPKRLSVEADDGEVLIFKVVAKDVLGSSAPIGLAPTITHVVSGSAMNQVLPNVSGLEVFGMGNTPEFTGRDCVFVWRESSNRLAYDIGDEPDGASSGTTDYNFVDYRVQLLNEAGDVLRTEFVKEPTYTYTYEKNFADTAGEPTRTFTVYVWQHGRYNQISARAAQLQVTNPQPALPSAVSLSSSFKQLFLRYIRPEDTDWAGVLVWASTTPGFTPGPENLAYKGPNPLVVLEGVPNTVYYIRYASFDSFGITGVTVSGEISDTVAQIVSADIATNTVLESHLWSELAERIDLVDGDALLTGSVAQRVAAEAAARAIAINTEVNDRITAVSAEASSRTSAIAAEALLRAAADTTELNERTSLAVRLIGNYPGTDLTMVTSGLLYDEHTARVSEDSALSTQMSLLFASVAGGFDPYTTWYFDTDVEGWTASGATVTWGVTSGWIEVDSSGTTPRISLTSDLSPVNGAKFNVVKMRILRTAGSGWAGKLRYKTSGHGFSDSYYETLADPGLGIGDYGVIEWDMIALTVGGTDWLDNDILNFEIQLGDSAADTFEIDFITLGRNGPGASEASILNEAIARATADGAEVTARQLLSTKLLGTVDPDDISSLGDVASGILFEELSARVSEDSALASDISSLTATVTSNNITLTSSISSEAITRASGDSTNASAILALTSVVDTTIASVTTEATTRADADSALSSLLSALTATVGTNTASIVSEASTRASSDISIANTLNSLSATVTSNLGVVNASITAEQVARANADSALASSISTLSSTVGGHTTSISTNASTVGGLSAQYTVKIDSNGYVSGYGLASTTIGATPYSEFYVRADAFAVGAPGAARTVPFIITGGVTYIDIAMIRDLTVDTIKITNGAITNVLSAYTAGVVGGGTIQTVVITSTGKPIQINAAAALLSTSGSDLGYTVGTMSITRDGTPISYTNFFVGGWYETITSVVVDTPSAGSHTYAASVGFANGSADIAQRFLSVMEVKK